MSDTTEVQAAANLGAKIAARDLAGPKPVDPAHIQGLIVPPGYTWQVVDLEKNLGSPRRAKGGVTVHDADSLVAYVSKHAEGTHTAIYADLDSSTITAVLNGHAKSKHPEPDHTGWGDHRCAYTARKSPEWRKWEHKTGTWLSQADFAEHIEECADEIVEPTAGEMLDLAQTLQANNRVNWRSQTILANGQRQFTYEETIEARAGQKGTAKIPTRFTLAVRPYDGVGGFYKVTARLQFRLRDGALTLRYILDRPHDILRAAFNDVVTTVETASSMTAYRGVAPLPLQ